MRKATVAAVDQKLDDLARRFDLHMIDENVVEKATLERIESKTNEMYEAFLPAKAGFVVIASLGRAAKPMFWILALSAAVVAYLKTGNFNWPPL